MERSRRDPLQMLSAEEVNKKSSHYETAAVGERNEHEWGGKKRRIDVAVVLVVDVHVVRLAGGSIMASTSPK